MSKQIQSIAIIDPIGDFGIGGYVYELAEGLSANGVRVDVYTSGLAQMKDLVLPRNHGLYPVLGSPLVRQRDGLRGSPRVPTNSSRLPTPSGREAVPGKIGWVAKAASLLMPFELAMYLKMRRYDVIWTQWPVMSRYGPLFWRGCKALRMRLAHTVHNVLPHEERQTDRADVGRVYECSDSLVVHSEHSREELLRIFPNFRGKTLKSRIGLYTMFPRVPGRRMKVREKLHIPETAPLLLFYGSVRPYKNIDGTLEALCDPRCANAVLVVAGRESGFPDAVPGDPLGRTRRIAQDLGVEERVRFAAGLLDIGTTSDLLEAADILLLPYLKSYGSGVLLLGMTFGLHILATRTGGMDEYLETYPAYTLLAGPDCESIAQGIEQASIRISGQSAPRKFELPHLEWRTVAKEILESLEAMA